MRKSKHDVFIVLICGILFYYYLFIFGFPAIDCAEYGIISDKPCYLIHEGIVWSSLFANTFMFLYVFGDKLLPFNRHYVIRYYYVFLREFKKKMKEGKEITIEYFNRNN